MTLTVDEKAYLVYLLSALQEHLESAIESCIPRPIPDEGLERMEVLMTAEINDPYAIDIQRDREDWRKAEDWITRLEEKENA